MVVRKFIGLIFAGVMSLSPAMAEVVVRFGPPHVIVERREHRPSRPAGEPSDAPPSGRPDVEAVPNVLSSRRMRCHPSDGIRISTHARG